MHVFRYISGLLFMFLTALSARAEAPVKRGGLVLQFDDGWTSWISVQAEELKKVGGTATGYINNQNIRSGRITMKDIQNLQNQYGWEIGTHTWHHYNAPVKVRQGNIQTWIEKELLSSITELTNAGIRVRSLVFPYNAFSPELATATRPYVDTFRRSQIFALSDGRPTPDGSLPATAIDTAHYVPIHLLKQWVDMAYERNQFLLLFSHRVSPDSCFVTGTVASVSATELIASLPVVLPEGVDFVLVPDMTRRPITSDSFNVVSISNQTIRVDRPNLATCTTPGATFMLGEAYSTRLSDFRELIQYASERMNFYRVGDVLKQAEMCTPAGAGTNETAPVAVSNPGP